MPSLKIISLLVHTIIVLLFVYYHPLPYCLMLLAPLAHLLFFLKDSSCYQNHCAPSEPLPDSCEMCGLPRWTRMRHCYKCERCVHKYDHHCFLMGACVGEFNHKYYLLFLYLYSVNTVVMLMKMQSVVEGEVVLNKESGVEIVSGWFYGAAIVMIGLYFNLFLGLFLGSLHTYLLLNNNTTWEMHKRDTIHYLKNIDPYNYPHPFSRGMAHNIQICLTTDSSHPIQWEVPSPK